MATNSIRDAEARLAIQTRDLNALIDNRLAMIEPCSTHVETFDDDGVSSSVVLDYFRVKLSNGDIYDDLTDLEALDLAKWWCSLPP
ncbi:hypothetical protein ACFVJ5_30990 [Nocardia sp. NPDC127606]|uniref:hypothetical protein n=1 Tax=Nocardia sp. NPDC127606 TaxID=3345406 RepID=UPI0036329F7F